MSRTTSGAFTTGPSRGATGGRRPAPIVTPPTSSFPSEATSLPSPATGWSVRAGAAPSRLRKEGAATVQAITGLDEVRREVGDVIVEVQLPQKGQRPTDSYEGDGYVIVRHPETEVVEAALAKIVRTLRVRLA